MNAQLSSRFESRDMADMALTRLRRAGIAYSSARVATENRAGSSVSAADFTGFLMEQGMGADVTSGFVPVIPYHGLVASAGAGETAVLSIKVSADQLDRARDVLRSSNGRDVRISI